METPIVKMEILEDNTSILMEIERLKSLLEIPLTKERGTQTELMLVVGSLVPLPNDRHTSQPPKTKKQYPAAQVVANLLPLSNNTESQPLKTKKKYPCGQCSKVYNHSSNRCRHVATEHGPFKKHICPKCEKIFKRKDYLRHHLKRQH